MAEEQKKSSIKESIAQTAELKAKDEAAIRKEAWKPKTSLGRKVKVGEITSISEALDFPSPILEPEIVEVLLLNLESDLLAIGQSKGKFGGGKRRAFRQTQKKTKEGNTIAFATFAVVGNNNGFVGIGYGKSKETIPAREKAFREAKLNLIKIKRGCGSWECGCGTPHSIPFAVSGKCGSVVVELFPAPKGTGLCVEKECQKVMRLAGIKDVWSKTHGQTKTKFNLIKALVKALNQLVDTKLQQRHNQSLGIVEGVSIEEKRVEKDFLDEDEQENKVKIEVGTGAGAEEGKKQGAKNIENGRTNNKKNCSNFGKRQNWIKA